MALWRLGHAHGVDGHANFTLRKSPIEVAIGPRGRGLLRYSAQHFKKAWHVTLGARFALALPAAANKASTFHGHMRIPRRTRLATGPLSPRRPRASALVDGCAYHEVATRAGARQISAVVVAGTKNTVQGDTALRHRRATKGPHGPQALTAGVWAETHRSGSRD